MDYTVRSLTGLDQPIVWMMLMVAAHESSLEPVQTQPELARYAQDWGRYGDMGHVACRDGEAIGAIWIRLWTDGDRGFGYLDPTIPELAMAVLPDYRGQGVGTQLLTQMLATAQEFFPALCLNVRADNHQAIALYQRAGFVKVAGSEIVNRTGGVSFNMLRRFEC